MGRDDKCTHSTPNSEFVVQINVDFLDVVQLCTQFGYVILFVVYARLQLLHGRAQLVGAADRFNVHSRHQWVQSAPHSSQTNSGGFFGNRRRRFRAPTTVCTSQRFDQFNTTL
jgi:hypothetical protein